MRVCEGCTRGDTGQATGSKSADMLHPFNHPKAMCLRCFLHPQVQQGLLALSRTALEREVVNLLHCSASEFPVIVTVRPDQTDRLQSEITAFHGMSQEALLQKHANPWMSPKQAHCDAGSMAFVHPTKVGKVSLTQEDDAAAGRT